MASFLPAGWISPGPQASASSLNVAAAWDGVGCAKAFTGKTCTLYLRFTSVSVASVTGNLEIKPPDFETAEYGTETQPCCKNN
jgi:hypothetical protein